MPHTPPVNRIRDTCENITLPQLHNKNRHLKNKFVGCGRDFSLFSTQTSIPYSNWVFIHLICCLDFPFSGASIWVDV